jgi:hypothetical protein
VIKKITDTEATMLVAFFVGFLFTMVVIVGIFDWWAYSVTGLSILMVW